LLRSNLTQRNFNNTNSHACPRDAGRGQGAPFLPPRSFLGLGGFSVGSGVGGVRLGAPPQEDNLFYQKLKKMKRDQAVSDDTLVPQKDS